MKQNVARYHCASVPHYSFRQNFKYLPPIHILLVQHFIFTCCIAAPKFEQYSIPEYETKNVFYHTKKKDLKNIKNVNSISNNEWFIIK